MIDFAEEVWEIKLLICPNGHQNKMSIMKNEKYRTTYCSKCGHVTTFGRVEMV